MMRGMPLQPLHKIALALGSNIGDRLANLRKAREALARYVTITAASPVYETAPAYVTDQPSFLNAALTGETALEPQALLFTVKNIERDVGRTPTFRFGPRVIDIDILFYGDLRLLTPELSVPHPALAERSFVLKPLADIAPDWPHPATGLTVRAMLEALPDADSLRPLDEAF
jgi:2-amino-4-hydroxy-6-hydroxymethyldihydropteridine diphosphokinase